MQIIPTSELEHLVRATFPEKPQFSAEAELGVDPHRRPIRFSTGSSKTGSPARWCSWPRISC